MFHKTSSKALILCYLFITTVVKKKKTKEEEKKKCMLKILHKDIEKKNFLHLTIA